MGLVDVHESRKRVEAKGLRGGSLGISEDQDLGSERPDVLANLGFGSRHEKGDAHIGLGIVSKDPKSGLENPRTFVGVRVEDHDRQMEVGGPFRDWTAFACQGVQFHSGLHIGSHSLRR